MGFTSIATDLLTSNYLLIEFKGINSVALEQLTPFPDCKPVRTCNPKPPRSISVAGKCLKMARFKYL